ncbi:MAG: cysteine--tRNA ligase [Methanobacteriota archaeon]
MLVHDTLSRRTKKFVPMRKGEVRMYTCGPSVYSTPHIGNFRTYIVEDVFKRALMSNGYKVNHTMNITDIEDKMVRAAKGSRKSMRKIVEENEKLFLKNSRKLNLIPADNYPRATQNIKQMVTLIKKLMKKGLAYKDDYGNVFFNVSRFPRYGMISHYKFKHKLDKRIYKDDYFQYEAGDFILWKAWRKSDGDIFWDTGLGRGRPGWHIECSAMSIRYLGAPFDMHMGGIDNVFSHHDNEIAQSAGATGKIPARYWVHVRHLVIYGKKMSKSLGRSYSVDELSRKGYGYDAIRAYLLSEHYRKRLNFTFQGLLKKAREINRCKGLIRNLGRVKSGKDNEVADRIIEKSLAEFYFHVNNDMHIPEAIDALCSLVRRLEALVKKRKLGAGNAKRAISAIKRMDLVLGFIF